MESEESLRVFLEEAIHLGDCENASRYAWKLAELRKNSTSNSEKESPSRADRNEFSHLGSINRNHSLSSVPPKRLPPPIPQKGPELQHLISSQSFIQFPTPKTKKPVPPPKPHINNSSSDTSTQQTYGSVVTKPPAPSPPPRPHRQEKFPSNTGSFFVPETSPLHSSETFEPSQRSKLARSRSFESLVISQEERKEESKSTPKSKTETKGSFLQNLQKKKKEKKEKEAKERIEFADLNKRIETFTSHPQWKWTHTSPSLQSVAEAGFIFRPKENKLDRCKCYQCGCVLNNWLPTDDPKQEHIRWRSNCPEVKSWGGINSNKELRIPFKAPTLKFDKHPNSKMEAEIQRLKKLGLEQHMVGKEAASKEQQLTSIRQNIRTTNVAIQALEKLVGFYASDPVAKKKAEQELEDERKKLEVLQTEESLLSDSLETNSVEQIPKGNLSETGDEVTGDEGNPTEWEYYTDPEGNPYWYHPLTKETRWAT